MVDCNAAPSQLYVKILRHDSLFFCFSLKSNRFYFFCTNDSLQPRLRNLTQGLFGNNKRRIVTICIEKIRGVLFRQHNFSWAHPICARYSCAAFGARYKSCIVVRHIDYCSFGKFLFPRIFNNEQIIVHIHYLSSIAQSTNAAFGRVRTNWGSSGWRQTGRMATG